MIQYRIDASSLKAYIAELFAKTGLTPKDSNAVADLLVHANLRGVHSHGAIRVPAYLAKIRDGGASLTSDYPVVLETANTAVIDAQGGLGALVGEKAVSLAREKAKNSLISLVVVRNSNHFGMAGHWALKLAGDDMVGFACSTCDLTMGPPGCREPFMGNNPFAFAVKASEQYPEVCIDMATSGVALGKAKELAKRGQPIPSGWLLDRDGNDTTDVGQCYMMVPMAGHKGFGIAFIVEIFSTMLSGGVLSAHIHNQDLTDTPELASHCFGCVNISALRDPADFHASFQQYIDELHALPMRSGAEAAKYPGEIEYVHKTSSLKEGVALPEAVVDDLLRLGSEAGLDGAFLKASPMA